MIESSPLTKTRCLSEEEKETGDQLKNELDEYSECKSRFVCKGQSKTNFDEEDTSFQ